MNEDKKIEWRVFYKPPLTKKTRDLQWRIVHGVIAVNAFTSVFKSTDKCPFCDDRKTIFHAFLNCHRLEPLFSVLKDVFKKCNKVFSQEIFILGCKYVLKKKFVCQLLNFVVGQAKMAIFLSRKNKIEQDIVESTVILFGATWCNLES